MLPKPSVAEVQPVACKIIFFLVHHKRQILNQTKPNQKSGEKLGLDCSFNVVPLSEIKAAILFSLGLMCHQNLGSHAEAGSVKHTCAFPGWP